MANANFKYLNHFLFIIILFTLSGVFAQSFAQNKKYLVLLKDKANTGYSIQNPEAFLSPRSIARRSKQNIGYTEKDLPVSSLYLKQLSDAGAKICYASKWLNGVVIEADSSTHIKVSKLPILTQKPQQIAFGSATADGLKLKPSDIPIDLSSNARMTPVSSNDYGASLKQNQLIGVDEMHNMGYRGEGMVIAVFDAGFYNVHIHPAFKHLFDNKQLLGTYDFVEHETSVYEDDSHGMQVLSLLAAYLPGQMIGSAPNAQYYLFRTENASSEYLIETINWVIAAEKADSLGADIINSSLGYNTFDDTLTNFTYKQLNGKTTHISKAANYASATGMLVINSAGNEGNSKWQYINAPADADSVLTIGAVRLDSTAAAFSSIGPTVDGRIKPDMVAPGAEVTVASPAVGSLLEYLNGTSFSAPLLAGMVAGLWQAKPYLTNMQIANTLRQTASKAKNPNYLIGYGIPNFNRAAAYISVATKKNIEPKKITRIYPNPVDTQQLNLELESTYWGRNINVVIMDMSGKIITNYFINKAQPKSLLPIQSESLSKGTYTLIIYTKKMKAEQIYFTKF